MRLPLGFLLVCFLPLRCFIFVAAPKKREKAVKRRANELESTIPVIQLCVADPELRQGQYCRLERQQTARAIEARLAGETSSPPQFDRKEGWRVQDSAALVIG